MNIDAEKAWARIQSKNDAFDRVAFILENIIKTVDTENVSLMRTELENIQSYVRWAKSL